MKRAIEQAGSVCAGWISSCLFFCPGSGGDDESFHHQQSLKRKGDEREMKVCHTQPHLVPPMKLAVDSSLPRPSAPAWTSSTPSLELDSRLSSQRPKRASLAFKRKSTAPLRISGPSEFRTVSSFATSPRGFHPDSFILLSPGQFRPLELSFEASGNGLPDLPEFDTFQVEEECPVLTRPSRTLRTCADVSRISRAKSHRPSSSFQLVRKPVGSGSRRSSLATMEQLMDKQIPSNNPFVPHFSTRSHADKDPTASQHHPGHTMLDTPNGCGLVVSNRESYKEPQASRVTIPPRTPTNTTSTNLQDRPLPPIPVEDSPSSGTTQRPPTTPTETRPPTTPSENRNPNSATTTPTRSGRVTQWLFQSSNKASPFSSSTSPWKSTFTDKNPFRIRSRTLSGSTITSSLTSLTGGFKTTPSLSSNTIAATPARPSHIDPRLQKELDVPMCFSRPYTPKQADDPAIYPTIFEGQQQHQHPQNGYDEFDHNYYTTYRRSAVGLAF
ncbi:hypothetical protein ANOM_008312 [Aspergillus nomiae NRRL 13137]|uniref:Uncharacterized protein n=1 Tax=Aspergillus nomiae NRRL (strain ATCC 15546 / NRRL 13137 / CBS 260.88 / M93) TaxID=1509407 RepID=A0A0L1IY72_ASPN3|nr:uncharacterized protein ANOM_008312 [Aspergillus nomiae NRRL 13137]KNG84133.1 hypothetical protein ANOM_008312 [Aspergillus nomiae NRRL 13137]